MKEIQAGKAFRAQLLVVCFNNSQERRKDGTALKAHTKHIQSTQPTAPRTENRAKPEETTAGVSTDGGVSTNGARPALTPTGTGRNLLCSFPFAEGRGKKNNPQPKTFGVF